MKQNTHLERIIAKIDNDFNPDNSDWIPRVGAWALDAMSILKCTKTEIKRVNLPVKERIVYGANYMFDNHFKVYTINGCELRNGAKADVSMIHPSTGKVMQTNTTGTTDYVFDENAKETTVQAVHVNSKDYNSRYNYIELTKKSIPKYYYKIDSNKLELNFNTEEVVVEYTAVVTYRSSVYNCDLPVIPNNGLLIEAIAFYCLYKMLCRGYKHPVFNLHASQYGTNPYYIWEQLKDKAKRSVIHDNQGEIIDDGGLWQSAFFINTFAPRG